MWNRLCPSKRVFLSWLWHYIHYLYIYISLCTQSADSNPFRGMACNKRRRFFDCRSVGWRNAGGEDRKKYSTLGRKLPFMKSKVLEMVLWVHEKGLLCVHCLFLHYLFDLCTQSLSECFSGNQLYQDGDSNWLLVFKNFHCMLRLPFTFPFFPRKREKKSQNKLF